MSTEPQLVDPWGHKFDTWQRQLRGRPYKYAICSDVIYVSSLLLARSVTLGVGVFDICFRCLDGTSSDSGRACLIVNVQPNNMLGRVATFSFIFPTWVGISTQAFQALICTIAKYAALCGQRECAHSVQLSEPYHGLELQRLS